MIYAEANCGGCSKGIRVPAVEVSVGYTGPYTIVIYLDCPSCNEGLIKRMEGRRARSMYQMLAHAGAELLSDPWPVEHHRGGPALTEDDLIAFGLEVEQSDHLSYFAKMETT